MRRITQISGYSANDVKVACIRTSFVRVEIALYSIGGSKLLKILKRHVKYYKDSNGENVIEFLLSYNY